MAVKIRPLVLKDAASLRLCVGDVAQERRYLSFFEPFPLPQVRAFLRWMLREKNPAVVAIDEGRVVGWADVTRNGSAASRHIGTLGMGILPEYRGKGLGQKLLTAVLKKARRKFSAVELMVYRKNRPARKLYEKAGFEMCGVKRDAAKLAYGFDDIVIMQKRMQR